MGNKKENKKKSKRTEMASLSERSPEREMTLLSDWIQKNELSDSVIDALRSENLLSQKALLLLSERDFEDLKLRKGDHLILKEAVKQLQIEAGGGPLCQQAMAAREKTTTKMTLDQILGNDTATRTPVQAPAGGRVDLDPACYIRLPAEKGEPALKIVDFLSAAARENEEEVTIGGGLSIKFAKQKPSLEKTSPAMWMAANSRIMAALLQRGELDDQGALDYLAYTAKIGELACRFTWTSVLLYDDEYRHLQAATGFRWGADTPHLSTVVLRERGTQLAGRQPGATGSSGVDKRRIMASATSTPVCRQWNRGVCSYADRCNYSHTCLICGKPDHPAKDHVHTASQSGSPSTST